MLVACMGVSVSASAATCIGPPALEGRIHDHPSAEAYAAMGNWFAKNSQPECAVESFKSWLAIEPSSPKALDGLARALIAAGDYDAVIRRLPKAPRDESLILDLSLAYRKAEMFSESARVLATMPAIITAQNSQPNLRLLSVFSMSFLSVQSPG